MPPKHTGMCYGCGKRTTLTKHHIMPVRFFGRGRHNDHIALLCDSCHFELEQLIPQERKMEPWWYFTIVGLYLRRKHNERTT